MELLAWSAVGEEGGEWGCSRPWPLSHLLMSCGASVLSFADGERLGEVTDPGRRVAGAHASAHQRKAEDSSESREDEQMVNPCAWFLACALSLFLSVNWT